MNYTEKYHLPQWEETDRVIRTDFNQMCAGIENGLANAQSTADQGLAKASVLPYAVGRYTGTEQTQTIEIGFRPSFIVISGAGDGINSGYFYNHHYYLCFTSGPNTTKTLTITGTGFELKPSTLNGPYPVINEPGRSYEYIAFK